MVVSSITMKITEQKTETVTKEIVTDVRCNLCGESCLDSDDPHNNLGCDVNAHGCYGSAFPSDSTAWHFDLCQLCLAFLVSKFKIYPAITDGPFSSDDSTKLLLTEGKAEGLHEWVISKYAAAMSRGSLFSSSDIALRASLAAHRVSAEMEKQRETHRQEAWEMHAALDKIAVPYSGNNGCYPVDRVAALAGSTHDRLVTLLRKLYKIVQDRFDGKDVDRYAEAVALDEAHGYLTENCKLEK